MSKDINISPGQIWTIKNSQRINGYKALVLLLEDIDSELVVHISLLDDFGNQAISHLPFKLDTFLDSIDSLDRVTKHNYDFKEGYNYWRSEYEKGKAGIFGLNISDCVSV